MASPYQNMEFFINRIRSNFIVNNSDERYVIKPLNPSNMLLAYEDDFPSLQSRQYSPPISFNYKLKFQMNDLETMNDYNNNQDILLPQKEQHQQQQQKQQVPVSSTLKESLRSEQVNDHETSASQSTIQQLDHTSIKTNDMSSRRASNNLIKSNFNRLFRARQEGSISESNKSDSPNDYNEDDDDDDDDDDDYNIQNLDAENSGNNSDMTDDTDITNPEYNDMTGNGGTGYEIALAQDDLTKIDHDNLSVDELENAERDILDDEFDGEDTHFLTDSDLTDSDAFLADDSFYGSGISLIQGNNSSGNLLRFNNNRSSTELKKPSNTNNTHHNQHHHNRTRTLEKSLMERKTIAESIKSERASRRSSSPNALKRPSKSLLDLNLLSGAAVSGLSALADPSIYRQSSFSKPTLKSNLTLMLHEATSVDETSALEYFKFVGESEGGRLETIKVHLPQHLSHGGDYQLFKISRASLVKDFIGYILLNLSSNLNSKDLSQKKPKELFNPNYWCLRIVEDEGEVDDDFGPLDRNKTVVGFGVNEVLLQKVSSLDFQKNEKLYPLPRIVNQNGKDDVKRDSNVPQRNKSLINEESDHFDNETPQLFKDGVITLPNKPTTFLRDKNLEESLQERTSSFRKRIKEEPKKKFLSSYKQRTFLSSSSSKPVAKISSSFIQPFSLADNGDNGLTTSSFFKWTVWRHHQISFKNRHERSLSIDGEYIYIIPESTAEHENVAQKYFDANNMKTTSFHVSQILKCKQSRKDPTHLKIVVMKPTGPKRYDLEALDVIQCEDIVRLIKNLVNAYSMGR